MPAPISPDAAAARRAKVLTAARWYFLNLGFAKTSLDDIARRAGLSRTLLYQISQGKEDIYRAVFEDWLLSRLPVVKEAVNSPGSAYQRLLRVCRLVLLEPWAEMVNAPMWRDFFPTCADIAPKSDRLFRKESVESMAAILGDQASAEVFFFALNGLLEDQPSMEVLEQRTQLLAARFAPRSSKQAARS
jgi:Transcriptional regulator